MLSCPGLNISICFSQEEMLFWIKTGNYLFPTSWQTLWVFCMFYFFYFHHCICTHTDPYKSCSCKNWISVGFQSWMPRVWSCRLLRCIVWNLVLTSSPMRVKALTFLSSSRAGEQTSIQTSIIMIAASACAIFMANVFYCDITIQGLTRRTDKNLQ